MVQLTADWKNIAVIDSEKFQFQYGAIDGDDTGVNPIDRLKFQFQYGAIDGQWWIRKGAGFCCVSIPVWCNWRPTISPAPATLWTFQFQYGAIDGVALIFFLSIFSWFQFQYGAIDGQITIAFRCFRCLVSIPVWCNWRDLNKVTPLSSNVWFQFQYGAIDCRRIKSPYLFYVVSIPVWCNWRWLSPTIPIKGYFVSIPVWCNWRVKTQGSVIAYNLFQFQYGAIDGEKSLVETIHKRCFNSSMVQLTVNTGWL